MPGYEPDKNEVGCRIEIGTPTAILITQHPSDLAVREHNVPNMVGTSASTTSRAQMARIRKVPPSNSTAIVSKPTHPGKSSDEKYWDVPNTNSLTDMWARNNTTKATRRSRTP